MMALNNVDPNSLRKYIFEYALLGLTAAVIYLFALYMNLNSFIRDGLMNAQIENQSVIRANTKALQDFETIFNQHQNQQK